MKIDDFLGRREAVPVAGYFSSVGTSTKEVRGEWIQTWERTLPGPLTHTAMSSDQAWLVAAFEAGEVEGERGLHSLRVFHFKDAWDPAPLVTTVPLPGGSPVTALSVTVMRGVEGMIVCGKPIAASAVQIFYAKEHDTRVFRSLEVGIDGEGSLFHCQGEAGPIAQRLGPVSYTIAVHALHAETDGTVGKLNATSEESGEQTAGSRQEKADISIVEEGKEGAVGDAVTSEKLDETETVVFARGGTLADEEATATGTSRGREGHDDEVQGGKATSGVKRARVMTVRHHVERQEKYRNAPASYSVDLFAKSKSDVWAAKTQVAHRHYNRRTFEQLRHASSLPSTVLVAGNAAGTHRVTISTPFVITTDGAESRVPIEILHLPAAVYFTHAALDATGGVLVVADSVNSLLVLVRPPPEREEQREGEGEYVYEPFMGDWDGMHYMQAEAEAGRKIDSDVLWEVAMEVRLPPPFDEMDLLAMTITDVSLNSGALGPPMPTVVLVFEEGVLATFRLDADVGVVDTSVGEEGEAGELDGVPSMNAQADADLDAEVFAGLGLLFASLCVLGCLSCRTAARLNDIELAAIVPGLRAATEAHHTASREGTTTTTTTSTTTSTTDSTSTSNSTTTTTTTTTTTRTSINFFTGDISSSSSSSGSSRNVALAERISAENRIRMALADLPPNNFDDVGEADNGEFSGGAWARY
jgi:hypothetical protein